MLEPTLTFHGFRYAEVTGVPDLRAEDVEAVVIGTDLRRTGWFESSHALLNRFHENVVWGMRGNFLDVPTDCPQRDERLGWTGDIQVFAPTASFLFDSAGFLDPWLADLAAEQHKDGSVPFVVPDVLRQPGPAAAAWGDAATIVPWVLYQRTGDRGLLARQLPSMRAWVDRMADLAGDGPALDRRLPVRRLARPDRAAGRPGPAPRPTRTSSPPRTWPGRPRSSPAPRPSCSATPTWRAAVRRPGRAGPRGVRPRVRHRRRPGAQRRATAYALALEWALLPRGRQRHRAGQRLADLVRAAGFRIGTGFVGTPLITDALTDAGEPGPGLPAAAADRLPVLALPGDDGRHHGLGALGQHAARRQHQPRRDDLVQPLRARRGRRLAAPAGRRPRAGRAGLPRARVRPLPGGGSPARRPAT